MTTEKITGKIKDVWDKPVKGNKTMCFVKLDNDEVYSKFGSAPDDLKKAKDEGPDVCLEFTTSGQFKNIKNISVIGGTEKPNPQPTQNATLTPQKTPDFDKASNLPEVDLIIHGVDYVMRRCREKATEMIGHKPITDGENAMQNSIFIEVNKKMNNPMFMRILREFPRG